MGRLVTVAGVGSSRCLLFSGAPGEAPLPLTDDHVIHTHLRERQRLLSVSCTASPGGSSGLHWTAAQHAVPLAAWPSTLAASSAQCVLAAPAPQTGRQVAAVDVSGSGPAPTPVRGSGVLRLWPGELLTSGWLVLCHGRLALHQLMRKLAAPTDAAWPSSRGLQSSAACGWLAC